MKQIFFCRFVTVVKNAVYYVVVVTSTIHVKLFEFEARNAKNPHPIFSL